MCAGPDAVKSAAPSRGAERPTPEHAGVVQGSQWNQEVTNIFPPVGKPDSPGRPNLIPTFTEMDPTQQPLFRLFALDRYRNP
jgi:hypothetical protein